MIKSLEERKIEYLDYIYEECKGMKKKWWQSNSQEFISLRQFARKSKHVPDPRTDLVIKFSFKKALLSSAFFLSFFLVATLLTGEREILTSAGSVIFFSFIACINLTSCLKHIRNATKMKMDQQGVRVPGSDSMIMWKDVISSYIREDNSSDDSSYFLVIHYYDKAIDIFTMIEIELSGLNLSKEAVAIEFEVRRIAGQL